MSAHWPIQVSHDLFNVCIVRGRYFVRIKEDIPNNRSVGCVKEGIDSFGVSKFNVLGNTDDDGHDAVESKVAGVA